MISTRSGRPRAWNDGLSSALVGLRLSALDLARLSKVGVATIRRVEVIDGEMWSVRRPR